MDDRAFDTLETYLLSIPSVEAPIGKGADDTGWWVKFSIDVESSIAWHTVQELGHVLNYLSLNERLPTTFRPVSPPPYLNGGPGEYLSWVIECRDPEFKPGTVAKWLEGRLPRPVDDLSQWLSNEE